MWHDRDSFCFNNSRGRRAFWIAKRPRNWFLTFFPASFGGARIEKMSSECICIMPLSRNSSPKGNADCDRSFFGVFVMAKLIKNASIAPWNFSQFPCFSFLIHEPQTKFFPVTLRPKSSPTLKAHFLPRSAVTHVMPQIINFRFLFASRSDVEKDFCETVCDAEKYSKFSETIPKLWSADMQLLQAAHLIFMFFMFFGAIQFAFPAVVTLWWVERWASGYFGPWLAFHNLLTVFRWN